MRYWANGREVAIETDRGPIDVNTINRAYKIAIREGIRTLYLPRMSVDNPEHDRHGFERVRQVAEWLVQYCCVDQLCSLWSQVPRGEGFNIRGFAAFALWVQWLVRQSYNTYDQWGTFHTLGWERFRADVEAHNCEAWCPIGENVPKGFLPLVGEQAYANAPKLDAASVHPYDPTGPKSVDREMEEWKWGRRDRPPPVYWERGVVLPADEIAQYTPPPGGRPPQPPPTPQPSGGSFDPINVFLVGAGVTVVIALLMDHARGKGLFQK